MVPYWFFDSQLETALLAKVKTVSTQKCDTLVEFYYYYFLIFRQWLCEPGNQSVQFEWRKSQHHKVS